jgi:hypothetical protein
MCYCYLNWLNIGYILNVRGIFHINEHFISMLWGMLWGKENKDLKCVTIDL